MKSYFCLGNNQTSKGASMEYNRGGVGGLRPRHHKRFRIYILYRIFKSRHFKNDTLRLPTPRVALRGIRGGVMGTAMIYHYIGCDISILVFSTVEISKMKSFSFTG